MKTEEEGSDYLVDHSIIIYLMDPRMEFVKFFGKNNDADSLADGVINEVKQYRKIRPPSLQTKTCSATYLMFTKEERVQLYLKLSVNGSSLDMKVTSLPPPG
ncbi:hypothetical protein M9H77_22694 [Catharanthus roseus]|uniref:Uncharacterized protein n=1 Tax=Catharanthus roseus TaxID=4058 RepID=A0ACC0ARL7_CATRO|nr:hypothetical protein M9H77_22694 [Catharanthus roseus]